MAILGGILVIVLASFVLAYFASRTWHWGYVTVVVLIVLFSAGFFILSAEVLRVNAIDRSKYNKAVADVEKATAQVAALKQGTEEGAVVSQLRGLELKLPEDASDVPGIVELEHQIRMITQLRGPVWKNVSPTGMDRQTGGVRVNIPAPSPTGLAAESVVYLFEEGDVAQPEPRQGKQYLGEFRVAQVAGQDVTLLPALELAGYQRERLESSRGPWVIYETMPLDQYGVFANMSEEQLRRLLPEASVEEFLRQGKEPSADDEPYRKAAFDASEKQLTPAETEQAAKTVYHRRIRDYATELRDLSEKRALLQTAQAGLEADNQRLVEAAVSAERLTAFRQDRIAKLTSDLAGLTRDREAVDRLSSLVQQQLETIQRLLGETLSDNSRLVRQLAAIQTAAAATPPPQAAGKAPEPTSLGRAN